MPEEELKRFTVGILKILQERLLMLDEFSLDQLKKFRSGL
jgi:hypothetical protein